MPKFHKFTRTDIVMMVLFPPLGLVLALLGGIEDGEHPPLMTSMFGGLNTVKRPRSTLHYPQGDGSYRDWVDDMRDADRAARLAKEEAAEAASNLTSAKPLAKLVLRVKDRRRSATVNDNTIHTTPRRSRNMPTVKTNASTKPATTRKRAASKPKTTETSIEVGMARTKEPKGSGGVRFDAEKGSAVQAIWLAQEQDKALGSPKSIVVSIMSGD